MTKTLLIKRMISYMYTFDYKDDRNSIPPDETMETIIGERQTHLKQRLKPDKTAYLIARRTSLPFSAVFAYTVLQINTTSRT
jgi:hypothetical protein